MAMLVCKYVDQRGLATMLTAKWSAGFAPEVNPRNSLHTGKKAHKWGILPGSETHSRCHQKSKTGISVAPQKGLVSSNFVLKKSLLSPQATILISGDQWTRFLVSWNSVHIDYLKDLRTRVHKNNFKWMFLVNVLNTRKVIVFCNTI